MTKQSIFPLALLLSLSYSGIHSMDSMEVEDPSQPSNQVSQSSRAKSTSTSASPASPSAPSTTSPESSSSPKISCSSQTLCQKGSVFLDWLTGPINPLFDGVNKAYREYPVITKVTTLGLIATVLCTNKWIKSCFGKIKNTTCGVLGLSCSSDDDDDDDDDEDVEGQKMLAYSKLHLSKSGR